MLNLVLPVLRFCYRKIILRSLFYFALPTQHVVPHPGLSYDDAEPILNDPLTYCCLRTLDTVASFHAGKFQNTYVFIQKIYVMWNIVKEH